MKKRICALLLLELYALMFIALPKTASAASAEVVFDNISDKFSFSPVELFDQFSSVMPGDELSQKFTVKNSGAWEGEVKIYLRLEADEEAEKFLSYMRIKIMDEDGVIIDERLDETGSLSDIAIAKLLSNEAKEFSLNLSVDKEMPNEYQQSGARLRWVFTAEKLGRFTPVTGDSSSLPLSIAVLLSVLGLCVMMVRKAKG